MGAGVTREIAAPRAAVWQRSEVFACVALAGLVLAMVEGPALNPAGSHPCRSDPPVFMPGADRDVNMTVSHNAACAIWAKTANISVKELTITVAPQHGSLALRGRTGVIYRPARGFTGSDRFSFSLRGHSPRHDDGSLVRVDVTVR